MQQSLKELFKGKKVLIAGDIMLDSYIFGSVDRISPEAPVPVVAIEKRENRPGGAANVAFNIKSLGAEPMLCAVIGNDAEGEIMKTILLENGISTDYIFVSPTRKTTAKLRVMSQRNQLLRLDYEQTDDLDEAENKQFMKVFENAVKNADVMIMEDYNKGLLTSTNIPELISLAHQNNVPITVDPKKKNFWEYKNVELFKPNLKELKEALNSTDDLTNETHFLKAIREMEAKLNNKISFITLSERGVFIKDKQQHHFLPAFIRRIADVSGAGDTVISVASLCLSIGLSVKETAFIANLAGGLVCEEPGVVPINIDRLEKEYSKVCQ
ncbi:MAG: D-glycero-beta-D-manno-heptose-7-phosphate kinase [Bacteroidetes bacterium]|nr:D-glycero-beta-D-manno-heptose-7-phosphate kinase [Bacteroidota bacterium]